MPKMSERKRMELRQKEILDQTRLVILEASRLIKVGERYARVLRALPPPVCSKEDPDRSLRAARLLQDAEETFRYMVCHWASATLKCERSYKRRSKKGDAKVGWDAVDALAEAVAVLGQLGESDSPHSSLATLRAKIGKIVNLTLGL